MFTFRSPIRAVSSFPPRRMSAEFCSRSRTPPPLTNIWPMFTSRVSASALRARTRAPFLRFLSMLLALVARLTSSRGSRAVRLSEGISTNRSRAVRSQLMVLFPIREAFSWERRARPLSRASICPLPSIPISRVKARVSESTRAWTVPSSPIRGSSPRMSLA